MKKFVKLALLGGLIVGFVACGESGDSAKNTTQTES